jgi:tryptophan halogenase
VRINNVAILGGGSAGFLAALALQQRLLALPITVIKSEQVPVIGVGEATTWAVPRFLHSFLKLDQKRFYREVRPAFKTAVRLFFGARPHFDYTFEGQMSVRVPGLSQPAGHYAWPDLRTPSLARETLDLGRSPLIRLHAGSYTLAAPIGYHIENEAFVGHLETVARERGIAVRDALVERIRQDERGIAGLVFAGGEEAAYDLYVDCSGFRSRLLRQELKVPFRSAARSLFCDRAVVGGWPRTNEPVRPYTSAVTMQSGWAFVTEHWDRINAGYVYSSAFITDEDAEREFRAWAGERLTQTRVVPYVSGRAERAWEKNVVAIGNSSGFVEPLQSTGLHVICDMSRYLAGILEDSACEVRAPHLRHFNKLFESEWDHVTGFLAMHYKLNDRLATPFWRAARSETDLAGAEEVLEIWRECGPATLFESTVEAARGLFGYDGFLTLLVGMRTPSEHDFSVSAAERAVWERVLRDRLADAPRALPMQDALDLACSDSFRWDPALDGGLPLHPSALP